MLMHLRSPLNALLNVPALQGQNAAVYVATTRFQHLIPAQTEGVSYCKNLSIRTILLYNLAVCANMLFNAASPTATVKCEDCCELENAGKAAGVAHN